MSQEVMVKMGSCVERLSSARSSERTPSRVHVLFHHRFRSNLRLSGPKNDIAKASPSMVTKWSSYSSIRMDGRQARAP